MTKEAAKVVRIRWETHTRNFLVSFEAKDSSADMLACQQLRTTLAVPSLLQAARLFTAVGVRET